MHKTRTKRTRTRQTGSSIPVRSSNNEQTRKTVYSVRSDGSGGETSTMGNSNEESEQMICTQTGSSIPVRSSSNEQTRKTVYSVRSDGSGGETSTMGNSNEESEQMICTQSGFSRSPARSSSNEQTRKTVYTMRSDGSGGDMSTMGNLNNEETQNMICTSRSGASDGEITTVRQTFRIVGTIDKDNRCSMESLESNKDSAFHGSQDLISQDDNDSEYSEVKMMKTVSFEEVGSNDGKLWIKPSDDIKVELEQEVGEDEELLKEELLRIFDRERFTLGNFFKNKMEDLARDYRKREIDLDDHSRAEIAEIESEMAHDKADMQKIFADEIAALTRTFNEDRASMEHYHKEQIKDLREQFANDHKEMDQRCAREKMELQEKMESEFQAMLRAEITDTKRSSIQELTGLEDKYNTDKLEMERRHSMQLDEADVNTKKVKGELEMMFTQEKARLEEVLKGRIMELERQLNQEREMRIRLEALLEEEKGNVTNLDSAKKSEAEYLKSELEGLRVELDEKNRVSMEMSKFEEEIRVNGKNGLNGKLREDFEKIVDEHKQELERKYTMDKEELQKDKERQMEEEKKKIQDDVEYERKKMKDEIEKERKGIEISVRNGHFEGMTPSRDNSSRRSTEKPEYSASISYGQSNQEQEKFSQYKEDQVQKGVEQFGQENDRKKDGDSLYANSRDDGRYGDRDNQGYKTSESKGYTSSYSQEQVPGQPQVQYNDPYIRDDTRYSININPEQARPEQYQSQSDNSFRRDNDRYTSPAVNREQEPAEQRRSEYNPYNQEDGRYSNAANQDQQPEERRLQYDNPYNRNDGGYPSQDQQPEQRRSQYENPRPEERRSQYDNPNNREDGRYPNPVNQDQQPEERRTQYDNPYKRHGSEMDSFQQRNEPGQNSGQQPRDQPVPSCADAKPDHFYVTPGNENSLRSEMNNLRSENEGLKAKIGAMEENIDLHKKYKVEAKDELSRLQKTKDELQSRLSGSDKDQEDAKRAKGKVDKLEKSLRESEARRKEFEAKVKELDTKLSSAEEKAQQAKVKTSDLEGKIRGRSGIQAEKNGETDKRRPSGKDRYTRDLPSDGVTASDASHLYQDHRSSGRYGKDPDAYSSNAGVDDTRGKGRYTRDGATASHLFQEPESSGRYGKEPDPYPSSAKPVDNKRDKVYGYPAEMSQSIDLLDYKNPYDSNARNSYPTKDEPQASWKNPESKKGKCAKCTPYSSKSKTTSRPGVSSSPHPIYGSHERLGKSADKPVERYKPGRYSTFGGANDPGFNTSSPRKPDGYSYGNDGVSAPNDDRLSKKEIYDKAVAERDKLVQLIKELKDKVEELYTEKERIDKEESKLRMDPIGYSVSNDLPSDHDDLKSKVEEMQRTIRVLAERLKRDAPTKRSSFDNGSHQTKPSMQDIEYLQDKLQRTGDAINHTNDNLDPEVLRRIEREVKTIGELIKSHCCDEEQGGSTNRSEDSVKVLQLQMDKQELEMKLNMAKDAMNDYVNRLSEKMEDLEGANALSDATLQELYDRNAKLKETLKALEKGQKRSKVQNDQLRHQTSALQNVIGQICKCEDTSFCSQYSTPRQAGKCCHDGNYGYTMTSQAHCQVPELDFSDRFSSNYN